MIKFEELGEPAYGIYLRKILTPIHHQLRGTGFSLNSGFTAPISIEYWGPPEERERCMWCVVKKEDGSPIGTLVLRMFHSHIKFTVPTAPEIFALDETEQIEIIKAISNAQIRLNHTIGGVLHQDIDSIPVQRWDIVWKQD